MLAYEFIAHDMSGLTLSGVTDDGYCEWIGTREMFDNAQMQEYYFLEHGTFFHGEDERHAKHLWDANHGL